ncbi:MAG: hypothetical protein MK179_03980 [Pirellulaceae bacterium]|nr:hypothetical protein [Pirellulaceae bacterium]
MKVLSPADEKALADLASAIVDQQRARVAVKPQQTSSGFWFGGGNLVADTRGSLWLVGRYRDAGDSRSGLQQGKRGWQLSVLHASDVEAPFEEVGNLQKSSLGVNDRQVLSIEGSALRQLPDSSWELYVSSEKTNIGYPEPFTDYLKPDTGVWTIDRLRAQSIDGLLSAAVETVVESRELAHMHVKDPFLYELSSDQTLLLFCTHPYCWTSSNSAYVPMRDGDVIFRSAVYDFFARGFTWDVAMTRATCAWDVPAVGRFQDRQVTLLFYDGGESLRNMDEHETAVRRARGYSCEELGGVAYVLDRQFANVRRLSRYCPSFVSPWGTGCSRYVDVLTTKEGVIATWQQSQDDLSQPLVRHFLKMDDVHRCLA